MSRVIENTAYPSAMEVKLRRIRWRQVGIAVVRAVAIAGAALIGAMLVAMLADWWLTLFSTGVRAALTITSLSLATAVFLMVGVRPIIHAFGWARAANEADSEVPQLEERWTTVSHFAKSGRQPNTTLSQAMLKQVTSEAVALGTLVEPARVVRVARLRRVLMMAGACAVALGGFLAANWQENSVLLRRFWAPTASITATQLTSVTGDAAVPRGQAVSIVTTLSGLERDAASLMLVTDSDDSNTITLAADPDSPQTFTHYVDVDESFRYRVRAGDGQTRWHSITAIDPPEISEVRLTVTAPEYVDRPPYEKSLIPGRVKAIQGSRLTLEMRSEAELERFELLLTSDDELGEPIERTLTLTSEDGGWYRFETLLEKDLSLSPNLYSPYGLTNEDRRVCRIRVIPDKAPVARVISPTDEMSVSPDEVLDIKFEAHDDHGIAKAELVVYRENEDGEQEVMSIQEIPLDDQQLEKHILSEVQLDLSDYELDEGTNISYAVRVTDNRMLNLDPKDIAARKAEGDSPQGESDEAADANNEAASLANASESENPTEEGESPNVAETASASEKQDSDEAASGESHDGEAAPEETQVAKADAVSGSKEPSEESSSNEGAANAEADEKKKSDPAASVAESGKEGLRVGDDKPEPSETAATESAEGSSAKDTEPSDTTAVAAGEGDASMPTENPEATGDKVAAGEPSSEQNKDAITEGEDSSESPANAIAATKPAEAAEEEDAEGENASAVGSAQTPTDANPQLAQSGSRGPQDPQDDAQRADSEDPANANAEQADQDPRRSGSIQLSEAGAGSPSNSNPPPDLERDMQFETQRGQNTESNRMRLRITDRLAAVAEAGESRRTDTMNTRRLLEKIDEQLEAAEATLVELNEQPDLSELAEKSKHVDGRLEAAERIIADLRNDSKETKYEFVGLQMLDIGRTHLTPARDRMFVLIQDPGSNPARNVLEALHHTSAARELLAALTKRFEEVARERELAEALEEVAEIYEVYVENTQGVLREAQKNQNPLRRKMAVVEVDEAYLERYADVLEMRREIMAEFARILADDPRLMGKYMDMIKRRDGNLRNRLTDLRELQEEFSIEVSGWLRVDEAQRPDVWIQVAEMRLLAAKDLVKSALELEARTLSQLPLKLEPDSGIGGQVVRHAKEVALKARQSSLTANELMNDALENDEAKHDLVTLASELTFELTELDAVLERLAFEHEEDDEVGDFTTRRLAESRAVAELAIAWVELASHVKHERFHGLAAVDQQKLAVDTDRLRVDMDRIENDLAGLFRPDDVPAEVTNIIRELMIVMETITFNQAAATYELNNGQLEKAEAQQTMAIEGFERAEELFDKMRRTSVDILDEREVQNPNIADLEDPTLDEFLERLEREPNLRQLLGIPNRPSNLRVLRDWMLWQTQGGGGAGQEGSLQQAAMNASQRAMMMAQRKLNEEQKQKRAADDGELTEEEAKQFAKAEETEEDMQRMLQAIEEKMKDPATDEEQRKELQKNAEMLAQMLEEAREGRLNRKRWEELAKSDEMKAMLLALANGEPIPDSQWNRLMSTLDTGLWQVRGRTPPEEHRKAIEQYQDQIRRLLNAEDVE